MQKARDAEGKRSKWFDFDLRARSEERKRLAEVVSIGKSRLENEAIYTRG